MIIPTNRELFPKLFFPKRVIFFGQRNFSRFGGMLYYPPLLVSRPSPVSPLADCALPSLPPRKLSSHAPQTMPSKFMLGWSQTARASVRQPVDSSILARTIWGATWLLVATWAAVAHAQPANPPGLAIAADRAWADLAQQSKPGAPKSAPSNPSDDKVKSPIDQEIDRLQKVAESARAFHTTYSRHGNAAEATKIEITSRLAAVGLGAPDYNGAARAAAKAFRADKRNPVADRFEVALVDECLTLSATPVLAVPAGGISPREKLADTLFDEFGGTAEINAQYTSLLRTSDAATVARLAAKLNQRRLPDDVKLEVRRALDFGLRLGRPVELSLDTMDGQRIDFAKNTTVTVVCFWNVWAGVDGVAPLAKFKGAPPAGTTWVYVALGATPPSLAAVSAAVPFAGKHCHDPSGLGGAAAATLGARQAPCVAVLGVGGKLIGQGSFEQLPALLVEASR